MQLYRIQVSNSEWAIEWHATRTQALAAFRKLVRDMGQTHDIYVDEMDVPTTKSASSSGRENLAEAMNRSQVNRDVWPGKLVKRHRARFDVDEELGL
jgi:hypothetical protein